MEKRELTLCDGRVTFRLSGGKLLIDWDPHSTGDELSPEELEALKSWLSSGGDNG